MTKIIHFPNKQYPLYFKIKVQNKGKMKNISAQYLKSKFPTGVSCLVSRMYDSFACHILTSEGDLLPFASRSLEW